MFIVTPQQRARAELRANFLYGLCELTGESCEIITYEKSRLKGNYKAWKTDGAEILLRGLTTPTGDSMPTALMRTSDILAVEYNENIILPSRCKVKNTPCSGDLRSR